MFGIIDSSFQVQTAYWYGSPQNEQIGDCALTSDNKYLIGVFGTNNYISRTATLAETDFFGGPTSVIPSDPANSPYTNCYQDGSGNMNCADQVITNIITTTTFANAANDCKT